MFLLRSRGSPERLYCRPRTPGHRPCRLHDTATSRYDKALWVAAFVFGNVLGAVAFFLWKRDRSFEATESLLLKAARDFPKVTAPPPPPAEQPAPAVVPNSTAIQRPADNRT
jgi:hypothetical protein